MRGEDADGRTSGKALFDGDADCFAPGRDVEFAVDRGEMGVDCPWADVELVGDLGCRQTGHDQTQDLDLTLGQSEGVWFCWYRRGAGAFVAADCLHECGGLRNDV